MGVKMNQQEYHEIQDIKTFIVIVALLAFLSVLLTTLIVKA